MDWLVSEGGAVVDGSYRQIRGDRCGATPATCEYSRRGPGGHRHTGTASTASAVTSAFLPRSQACIMRRIGLLRYGGTVSLNQMRYTIQAIPTFGTAGFNPLVAGYPVTTFSFAAGHDRQLARPAIARPARPSGRDIAC
jgi:hypothetical protein